MWVASGLATICANSHHSLPHNPLVFHLQFFLRGETIMAMQREARPDGILTFCAPARASSKCSATYEDYLADELRINDAPYPWHCF